MQKIDIIKIYKRKTALVIDDFPDMRGSIRRMLITFGCSDVDVASTGEEAIEKCREKHYDIILADYNLGEAKNGQQILEELRYDNLLRNTTIYMMITAETTRDMVFGALEYQPDDYLTKPFTQTVLQRRLDRQVLEREVLNEIYGAMDALDFDTAIEICNKHIDAKNRYSQKCFRIKARCLLLQHKHKQAAEQYRQQLEEQPVEWAEIGLGKALLAMNELDEAEAVFQKLIDQDCLCLEIYDHLAEVKRRKGEIAAAQQLLETAIEVSPNAILRQRALARISEDNGDWERAEKAHRKIVKLGNHSVYETPENYFGLARCISSHMRAEGGGDRKRIKDAEEALSKVRRKYQDNDDVKLQSDIINCAVYADAGKAEEAKERVKDLENRLSKYSLKNAQLYLDMANNYQAMGEHDRAKEILQDLARKFEDNEEICMQIDRLADEPMSKQGKRQAVELNRQGKELFTSNEYQKAIVLFSQALLHYPNNIALNLNLLLALVKEMSAKGASDTLLTRAAQTRDKISHISPDNELFERYQLLCKQVEKLRASNPY